MLTTMEISDVEDALIEFLSLNVPPPCLSDLRKQGAYSLRHRPLALIVIICQHALILCQLRQKSKPSHAVGGDSFAVNHNCTA